MSGDANELLGSAVTSTERAEARRFLLGTLTLPWALILLGLASLAPVARPRDLVSFILIHLFLPIFAFALIIVGLKLQRSRPSGSKRRLTLRELRGIACLADVPELGAVIMIHGGLIAAVIVSTVAFIVSLVRLLS